MTSTISEDALKGQQSRIMAAMRAATQQAPGDDLRNIASALTTQNNSGAGYFDTMRKFGQEQAQTNMAAETGIYNQMKEQVARGDAEAAAVDKAITDIAGADPKIYASIADRLHADPEPVNTRNAQAKVMKYAAELGINPLSVQAEKAKINKLNADAVNTARGGDEPSLVKTMKAYKNASPAEKAIMDRFGKVYEKNTYMDNKGNIVPIPGSPEAIKALADAKAAGTATGKDTAEAKVAAKLALPTIEAGATQSLQLIDDLVKHPGLSYAVGKSSVLPIIPGTDAADFKVRLDQLQGKQFLEAFTSLKGAGSITDVEGKKAEAAIARMQRTQSEPEFKKAAAEFQEVIKKGVERARTRAGSVENIPTGGNIGTNTNQTPIDYKEFFK